MAKVNSSRQRAGEVWRQANQRVKRWIDRFADEQHYGPDWSEIRALGNNRLARTSYIWFVITPLAARALEHAPSQITLEIGSTSVNINLALPFSWVIFFFAALLLSVGNLIYSTACPEIIRRYKSYAEFAHEGKGKYQLLEYLREIVRNIYSRCTYMSYAEYRQLPEPPRYARWEIATYHIGVFAENFFGSTSFSPPWKEDNDREGTTDEAQLLYGVDRLSRMELKRENEAFWWVYLFANNVNPIARYVCFWMYTFGLGLLAIVLIENILFVWRHVPKFW